MTRANEAPIISGLPPLTKIDRIKKNAPKYSARYDNMFTFISSKISLKKSKMIRQDQNQRFQQGAHLDPVQSDVIPHES